MKSFVILVTLIVAAVSATPVLAQSTAADKPISAVPPSGAGRESTSSAPSSASKGPTGTVSPGPAYNDGSANIGNSSERNGVMGSQGAAAGATMQDNHTSHR